MKKYQIELKGKKVEIIQDDDGKFLIPDFIKYYNQFGTALKPAYEPIIVARKPVENSVVENVMKYGVGGINIDECRIYGDEKISCHDTEKGTFAGKTQTMPKFKSKLSFGQYEEKAERIEYTQHEGRFPSNVIYDGSEEVCAGMPDGAKTGHRSQTSIQNCIQARKDKKGNSQCDIGGDIDHITEYTDSGSASRYFMNCKYTRKDDEIWKQLLVNNVENNLEILKATKDNIAQMNVEDLLKELKDHYAKYVENQQELIEISIVQDIVEILTWDFKIETSQVIQDFITNYNKCIQLLNLVQFVEKMDSIDTTQTTQNLLKLFGYVKVVITNYIQGNLKCEQNRYIYTPKASKKDRDNGLDMLEDGLLRRMRPDKDDDNPTGLNKEGRFAPVIRKNTHPTVKPVELMQYLVRLVSPKGATILDCFMGSGSTGKAVMFENRERNANYKFIGIEMTEEYLPIAKARIEYARDVFEYELKQTKEKTGQLNIFDFI